MKCNGIFGTLSFGLKPYTITDCKLQTIEKFLTLFVIEGDLSLGVDGNGGLTGRVFSCKPRKSNGINVPPDWRSRSLIEPFLELSRFLTADQYLNVRWWI